MPIEIRELVIKATIAPENSAGAQPSANVQSENTASNTEQVINTCVEKVLEILKTKTQR